MLKISNFGSNKKTNKYTNELWKAFRVSLKVAYKTAPMHVVILITLTSIAWIFPTAQTWAWRELLNAVSDSTLSLTIDENMYPIIFWAGVSVVTALFESAIAQVSLYMQRMLHVKLQLSVNVDTFRHAGALDLAFFENPEFEDIVSRSSGDVANHIATFLSDTATLINLLLQSISVAILLFLIDGFAVLILLPVAIPYIWFQWHIAQSRYEKRVVQSNRRRWLSYYTSCVMDRNLIPEVKIYDLVPYLTHQYREILHSINEEDKELLQRIHLRGLLLFDIAFTLAFFGMLGYAGIRILTGGLVIGDLAIYARTATQLRSFVKQGTRLSGTILEELLYVLDWQIFMNTVPEINRRGNNKPNMNGNISIKNVNFSYPQSTKRVLNDISFDIKEGETVAIVGENGSGKSTIIKLLTRLYDIEHGLITIDGNDIQDIDLAHYHKQFAYVPQYFNRFEATVNDNIMYGHWERLENNPDEIKRITQQSGIYGIIDKMPQKFDTKLGRRFGTYDLSGGQWQQIAIARALARDANIIILDEPTSSLDAKIEHKIFSQFRELVRDKTAIIISHRFSTLAIADRLIVLHDGRVVEQGTHLELLAQNGYYATMYNLQKQHITT